MSLIDIEKIGTCIADLVLEQTYTEKGKQDALTAKIARERLKAPDKKKTQKQEEEEEVEEEEIEIDKGDIGKKKGGDNFKADVPDEAPENVKFTDVVKQLNALRAGKSVKDEEVKKQLQQYLDGMGEGERQALFSYLTGLAAVLTGARKGDDAPSPSEPGFQQEIEPVDDGSAEEVEVRIKKDDVAPIVVGEVSNKSREFRILLENIGLGDEYRCHSGCVVPFGSPQCVDDINLRITDAILNRDNHPKRSEERMHYNGLLKILRKTLRAALKVLEAESLEG